MEQAYQKLGELLLSKELISSAQLEEALSLKAKSELRLGELLVRHGFVSEEEIAKALATQYGYEVVDPNTVYPTAEALDLLTFADAASQCLLPVLVDSEKIYCLVADPLNVPITDQLALKHRKKVLLAVAPDTNLKARIIEAYRGELSIGIAPKINLPDRFSRSIPRFESNEVVWLDAHDAYLDRPVSLALVPLESELKDVHLQNIKGSARVSDPTIAVVHDSVTYENSRVTIFQPFSGHQLYDSFRAGKPLSPAQAAKTISLMAKAATDLGLRDPSWICPENIWIDGEDITIAPIFLSTGDYRCDSDVEALGILLWSCLLGRQESKFDFKSNDLGSIPSGLILILQRCLTSLDDKFRSPAELQRALSTFKWANESRSATPLNDIDRDELLSTLRLVKTSTKASFWQRLFGRHVA